MKLKNKINQIRKVIQKVAQLKKIEVNKWIFCSVLSVVYTVCLTYVMNTYLPTSVARTLAAGAISQIYFAPATADISSEMVFHLWLESNGTPFDYARTEITFDKSVVQLSREIVYRGVLAKVKTLTSMATANSTGKIEIVAGLDPQTQNRNLPPNGIFNLLDIYLKPITVQNNVVTKVNINALNSEVVSSGVANFAITATGSNLTLNPLLPSPTPTAVPTAINTPTKSPIATNTPTKVPTSAPGLSCNTVCINTGYAGGTCRNSTNQCTKHKELPISAGDIYCTTKTNVFCCCN